MGLDVVIRAQVGAHGTDQFALHDLRFFERATREGRLIEQNLAADDLVDPRFIDLQFAQRVGQVVLVASGNEIGGRPLQYRDMAAISRDRGHERGRRCARADDDDLLAGVVEVFRPGLRVDELALVLVHPGPFGGVAFRMAIVALAHPEEVGGEALRFAGVRARSVDSPTIVLARPPRGRDHVFVTDVAGEAVLVDHVAHVLEDFFRACDRRARPRLEPIAERVEVAVGADARIAVRPPRAAEAIERFEHDETRARALLGQVIGRAHPGDSCPDDQHVEVLGFRRFRPGERVGCCH